MKLGMLDFIKVRVVIGEYINCIICVLFVSFFIMFGKIR